jgi:pSer/pThr/pTyr-binding forkhead associated (FHA) protein
MTQPELKLAFEITSNPGTFWLRVVIEPYAAPVSTRVVRVVDELLIGRDASAGLLLPGPLVSRRHVVVRAAQSGLEIEDVSSNGTLIDGEPLQHARVRTTQECTLQVGTIRLRLRRLQQRTEQHSVA